MPHFVVFRQKAGLLHKLNIQALLMPEESSENGASKGSYPALQLGLRIPINGKFYISRFVFDTYDNDIYLALYTFRLLIFNLSSQIHVNYTFVLGIFYSWVSNTIQFLSNFE